MNEKFLKEYMEKGKKALSTRPKLSHAEKLRRAKEQMGIIPPRKSSREKSQP